MPHSEALPHAGPSERVYSTESISETQDFSLARRCRCAVAARREPKNTQPLTAEHRTLLSSNVHVACDSAIYTPSQKPRNYVQ